MYNYHMDGLGNNNNIGVLPAVLCDAKSHGRVLSIMSLFSSVMASSIVQFGITLTSVSVQ